LELCRAARDDVAGVLEELPGRAEREPVVGAGEGGDETTAIDAAAERVILERFRGEDVRLVSEEAGGSAAGPWTASTHRSSTTSTRTPPEAWAAMISRTFWTLAAFGTTRNRSSSTRYVIRSSTMPPDSSSTMPYCA